MDKEITKVRFLLLIGLICLIVGFIICTKGPEHVFIGIIALIASSIILIASLFLAIRILQLKNINEVEK